MHISPDESEATYRLHSLGKSSPASGVIFEIGLKVSAEKIANLFTKAGEEIEKTYDRTALAIFKIPALTKHFQEKYGLTINLTDSDDVPLPPSEKILLFLERFTVAFERLSNSEQALLRKMTVRPQNQMAHTIGSIFNSSEARAKKNTLFAPYGAHEESLHKILMTEVHRRKEEFSQK